MTDNEIIKALECCSNGEPCANCPCKKQCDETDLAEIALDLINRQQTEIERLLNRLVLQEKLEVSLCNYISVREKTIKEFAESLNEKVENARKKYQRLCKEQGEKEDEAMNIHFKGIIKLINNLVKEKVGEE